MRDYLKQLGGLFGAAVAAACCLGISAVLVAVGAVGLGFIVRDAYLLPLFVGFVAWSLWLLHRTARGNGDLRAFWLGLGGGILAAGGLWLLVTGLYPLPASVYAGVALLVGGSLWDFANTRRRLRQGRPACEAPPEARGVSRGRRAVAGAGIAVAAAGVFYGLYRSVEAFSPAAEAGTIACYGINACKGQSACSTAYNACTGQNACKGKGWLPVTPAECSARGGVPLKGSPADPART